MGGKQRQAQRTKGNVKPSSSARAAELLVVGGRSSTSLGFVGFQGLSDGLGYVPAVASNDDADNSMDPDFRIVLRKLSKKDATTKLKALQEFSSLCQEKDVEAIKTVLPFWPRIYNRVAIDHDRRVREATQQAFEQLVLRVRRNLAPHLKSIIGTWLVAQNDNYAPAATSARSAFHAAFPPAKQTEALLFCKEEILSHIHENLIVHTAQTLSDLKTTEAEEVDAKYHRVVCASLNALKTFLRVIPPEQHQNLVDKYKLILKENKFWKYAKSQQAMIQSSFYGVLSALCQHVPDLAREFSVKISPAVLHHIDNTEPAVCSALWEAVLYTVSVLEDCWKHVNVVKAVLPSLWKLLCGGGFGSATVIYPNLLPFVSKLPMDVKADSINFYKLLFENMKMGLTAEKVRVSPSESDAIVRALMECMHYAVSQNITDPIFMDFIFKDQFLPLLKSSILDDKAFSSTTTLFPMAVDLLIYLQKLSNDDDDHIKATAASSAIATVLEDIQSLDVIKQGNGNQISRYASFLCTFKNKKLTNLAKTVSFCEPHTVKPKIISTESKLEFQPILPIVCSSCEAAYKQSLCTKSLNLLEVFSQVVKAYAAEDICTRIWSMSCLDILSGVIPTWIQSYGHPREKKTSEAFVDIISVLFLQCTPEEKVLFLTKSLKCIPDISVLHAFLQGVHKQNVNDDNIRSWFRSEEFGLEMINLARTLCQQNLEKHEEISEKQNVESHWQLLNLAFASDDKLEPVLGEEYLTVILSEIHGALHMLSKMGTMSESEALRCVSFICDVSYNFFANIKGCLLLPEAESLLLSIFQLSCEEAFAKSSVYCDKLKRTWQQGIYALIKQKGTILSDCGTLYEIVQHLKHCLLKENCTFERVQTLDNITLTLIQCFGEELIESSLGDLLTNDAALTFLRCLYQPLDSSDLPQWHAYVTVAHKLTLQSIPDQLVDSIPSCSMPKCLVPVIYTAQLLNEVIKAHSSKELPIGKDVIVNERVLDIAFGLALSDIMLTCQKQPVPDMDLDKVNQLLTQILSTLFNNISECIILEVIKTAIRKSLNEGCLWSLGLHVLIEEAGKKDVKMDVLHLAGGMEMFKDLTEPKLHTLQTLLCYFDPSVICELVMEMSEQVLKLTPGQSSVVPDCCALLLIISKSVQQQYTMYRSQIDTNPSSTELAVIQTLVTVLSHIHLLRQQHKDLFLFDCCIHEEQWPSISFNIEVMYYMKTLVQTHPTHLKQEAWDFILCSLTEWLQSCFKSRENLCLEVKTQAFAVAAFQLLHQVTQCLNSTLPKHPELCVDTLLTDWQEFFIGNLYIFVFPLFIQMKEHKQHFSKPGMSLVLSSLSAAISLCPVQQEIGPATKDECYMPHANEKTLDDLCLLLIIPSRAIQLAAYKLLTELMLKLSVDEEYLTKSNVDDKSPRLPPSALIKTLLSCSQGIELLLEDLTFGEKCDVGVHGDEYVITMGYLLSWKLLLWFFEGSTLERRAEYAQYLRDQGLLEVLLNVLYKLMPENPVVHLHDTLTRSLHKDKLTNTVNMFEEEPLLNIADTRKEEDIPHMACAVYIHALRDLPALVRHWYNSADKRVATIANKYTTKYVSPILCSLEIKVVQDSNVKLENMTIKTRPAAREVVATYTMEELSMELVVTLPSNHPLGQMTVECGQRAGVAVSQWRKWMLQLTTFLHWQNGSILDGLKLWRRNVKKRFEGVEECMICFSVIHGTNCQLPKLQCKTCKKRFHSACLYKWFNTSNNSSCPLCRNLF